ncbi:MAG: hypothetical protein JO107_08475 [Hyphomicrobiales bacterium]|nr:hypothetical protein [Hyphomicrobiales bacterium]
MALIAEIKTGTRTAFGGFLSPPNAIGKRPRDRGDVHGGKCFSVSEPAASQDQPGTKAPYSAIDTDFRSSREGEVFACDEHGRLGESYETIQRAQSSNAKAVSRMPPSAVSQSKITCRR